MKGAGYKAALIWYREGSQTAQVHGTECSVNIALAELNLAATFPRIVDSKFISMPTFTYHITSHSVTKNIYHVSY